jgi:hypothetical protein
MYYQSDPCFMVNFIDKTLFRAIFICCNIFETQCKKILICGKNFRTDKIKIFYKLPNFNFNLILMTFRTQPICYRILNLKSFKNLKLAKQKSPNRWHLFNFGWLILNF